MKKIKLERFRVRHPRLLLVLVLIPALLIIVLLMRSINQESENRAVQYSQNSTTQLKQSLDYHMKSIAAMADSIIVGLYDYVSTTSKSPSLEYDEFKTLNNLLNVSVNQEIISGYRLYVPDEKMYSRQKDRFYPISLLDAQITAQLKTQRKPSLWIAGNRQDRYYSNDVRYSLSYITTLYSLSNFETLQAVLSLDIPETVICDMLQNAAADSEVYLMADDGTILSATDKALLGASIASFADAKPIRENRTGYYFDPHQKLISWASLEAAQWKVVRVMPYRSATYLGNFRNTVLLLLLLLLVALLFFIMFSYILNSVIRRLNQVMINLRFNGLGVLEHVNTQKGSLATIEKNVDDLSITIRSLVEENYKVRLANRNAELKALQAQINPHFLYNTLDTIKWLILDGKTEASIATVNELSKYFRKSLNKGRDIVPLQDEYELVRSYMTIQKQRFHDDFQVIWDVDPSVLHTQLPKLTLQPIVENALLHGAQTKKDGKGCIWITIARKNKNVVIQIRDNGEGMTAEEARQAIQRDVEAKGYGISNVYQRLQLYGGDLQIQSDRHAGTSVLIIIPVKE